MQIGQAQQALIGSWYHSMLVNSHTAHVIEPHRATSLPQLGLHVPYSWIWRKHGDRIRHIRPSRLRAHQTQGSLGPDESQHFSDIQVSDEELYRHLSEEFPTDLADDTDPEGKELSLEDLVTAQGSIPASLRNELHSGDVWGPPVSPPSSPYWLGVAHQMITLTLHSPETRSALPQRRC